MDKVNAIIPIIWAFLATQKNCSAGIIYDGEQIKVKITSHRFRFKVFMKRDFEKYRRQIEECLRSL